MQLLSKLFSRSNYALNPARTASARHDFDVVRGFKIYEEKCLTRCTRHVAAPDSDISKHGVELLPLLSEQRATDVLADILSLSDGVRPSQKGIDYSETLSFRESTALLPLFEEILRGDVDAKIAGHFGSEYLIFSFGVSRTLPVEAARRSFLWHCDRGPRRFLKILLYLNGSEQHGGNTEFLDRETTKAFEQIGYVFGPNKRRSGDLAPLAKKWGIPHSTIKFPIRAGEGFLFEPSSTLHRGIMPSRGDRFVLSLMLVNSPVPWHEAFEAMSETRYCENNAGNWPAHADDISRMLGIEFGFSSSGTLVDQYHASS